MNRKVSRNEKYKYLNKKMLALIKEENTSALINIVQEDDSNNFELLQNLRINNLWFIIFKCSAFCLPVSFVYVLVCYYFTFTVYPNYLNVVVFMVTKGKKKQFKSQPPGYWNFQFFPTPYYSNPQPSLWL